MAQPATPDSTSAPSTRQPPSSRKPWGGRLGRSDERALARTDVEAVEREEHVENLARCRLVWSIMAPGGVLLVVAERLLRTDAGVRLDASMVPFVALGLLGAALIIVSRRAITPGQLRALDAVVYAGLSVVGAFMAERSGGFESHHVNGMCCILVAQGLAMPDHYRVGMVRLSASLVAFVAAMVGIAAWLSPEMEAQFRAAQHPLVVVEQFIMLLVVSAISLAAGHGFWRARRAALTTRVAGRYVLKRRIARGGMGDIWLARMPSLDREVVIKVLRTEVTNPEMLTRFGREISALIELRHPNTVRVYDWGAVDGACYYVMERLTGETLQSMIEREGALPAARAVHIVRQVARALAEAHMKGLVHRDVKPDNLFMRSDEPDFVKLLDFGIAKTRPLGGRLEEGSITRSGTVIGTAEYMAPEQVLGAPIDAGADVYALGAVLFYVLTGRAPFIGGAREVMRAHLHASPPDLALLAPHRVPMAVAQVVRRCLQKEPNRRFFSAHELDLALASAMVTPDIVFPDISHEDTHDEYDAAPTLTSEMRSLRAPPVVILHDPRTAASLPPTVRPPKRAVGE